MVLINGEDVQVISSTNIMEVEVAPRAWRRIRNRCCRWWDSTKDDGLGLG